MRLPPSALLILAALALATPAAAAEVAGPWRVTGDVAGRAFAVDCRFEPHGGAFGGVCVDAATGEAKAQAGKPHPLTKGAVTGSQVRWTYQASFLLAKFDVSYDGVLEGDRITGTLVAGGRKGSFTAVRK